jgi:transposase InsO family protein
VPFRNSDVTDERLRFVVAASRAEKPLKALAEEFGISRQTGHLWLNRYQEEGASGVLAERSRAPHRRPAESSETVVEAVLELRRRWPDWGARKLHVLLGQQRPELKVSRTTVHRIMDRNGLIYPSARHKPAVQRFERAEPNILWQMDFKGPKGFRQRSGPLSLLDDHSRYLLALQHLENARAAAVQNCLHKVFENNGLPDQMLIDHGTPWWNANSPWGWTQLSVWIMRLGIRIYLSGVRHPQTQGKIERMHGGLVAAIWKRRADADLQQWLDEYRHEYNHVRPHEALAMATPGSRYRSSTRLLPAVIRDWEYADSCLLMRLNENGQMHWLNRRWDVSRALAHQTVGIEVTGPRAIVYFCNTPMLELRPENGSMAALPVDPFRSLQC